MRTPEVKDRIKDDLQKLETLRNEVIAGYWKIAEKEAKQKNKGKTGDLLTEYASAKDDPTKLQDLAKQASDIINASTNSNIQVGDGGIELSMPRINNRKDVEGKPVFRSVFGVSPFNIKQWAQGTKNWFGQFILSYGTGVFGTEPYTQKVIPQDPDAEPQTLDGYKDSPEKPFGHSGRIYLVGKDMYGMPTQ
ncbi:MAG: hypothetical protein EOM41_08130 [Bacilli bacterium]|nr:hypothetical protein [Bacilli bacterium]